MGIIVDPQPALVMNLFSQGKAKWVEAVTEAEILGIRDVNDLTDMAFFAIHPERRGRKLESHEKAMINEWLEIQKEIKRIQKLLTRPTPTSGSVLAAPWMDYAMTEEARWIDEDETNVRWDEEYFKATPFFGNDVHPDGSMPIRDNRDWCAAFVNWCLHRAGFSHTGSAGNGSFKKAKYWEFEALSAPKKGCVIVVGSGHWKSSHVAFLWHHHDLPTGKNILKRRFKDKATGEVKNCIKIGGSRRLELLGGNQSRGVKDRVRVKNYWGHYLYLGKDKEGNRSPYLWPKQGSGCSIKSVPTDQPHHCGFQPS